ncbi:bifunctional diguanylate cyclase/phosphodiesterase [Undibacterium sp. SXout11W]|uniref:bifunctional diguanylate cyclase/phosphodiesterase n=1 Tax=Undibacterium sp. SXout11W TaxID=3413050 RepID=UPI003BF38180
MKLIPTHRSLSAYTRSFWWLLLAMLAFALMLIFYVRSAAQVEHAKDLRFESYILSAELRQSSNDLTRMARSYIATGDSRFLRYYQEILDIRDGKRPRPATNRVNYWEILSEKEQLEMSTPVTRFQGGKTISMLDLMRQASFSEAEFAKVAEAKKESDALTATERKAMHLFEMAGDKDQVSREEARKLLYDESYQHAKASIMHSIDDAYHFMDMRTADLLRDAQTLNSRLRLCFIFFGLLFLALLWRAHRALSETLGAPLEEIYSLLAQIGSGNFAQVIQVGPRQEASIKAWIALTQNKLAIAEERHEDINEKNRRLTGLYNALSQCNQAIVRSNSEQELFEKICHSAVVYGGMKMAWIGTIKQDTEEFVPVAYYGAEGKEYMEGLTISRQPDSNGQLGPISCVLINNEPMWCQNFVQDVANFHWYERGARHGWQSMAILPLHKNDKVVGTFNLFLDRINAFDEASRQLLLEMSMDISHALTRFELERTNEQSRKAEGLRSFMLEKINSSLSLTEILRDVVLELEKIIPDSICSIMLAGEDGQCLKLGAAPHLPDFYCQAIDGLAIAPGVGSCGNAIATGQRTIAENLATHPFWQAYKPLIEAAGLGSCWSEPIFSSANKVLGAFAIYHKEPATPQEFHLHLLQMAAHFIAIAIERKQSEDKLRKLSQAVEQSSNAIIITDGRAKIEYVNAAFLTSSGKTLHEVIGKRPYLNQSNRTSKSSYKTMLKALRRGENWHAELTHFDRLGSEHTDFIQVSPIRDEAGQIRHFLFVQEDITEKKRSEERIQYLAHFDALTGIANRTLLEERARYSLGRAVRSKEPLAVVFFDIDHFKDINDSLGHSFGDALLVELSKRLVSSLRAEDTISRLGGDEFVLLLPGIDSHGVEAVVQKLMHIVNAIYRIGEIELNITTSMGIAVFPEDGKDLETLSKNADSAMYRAKREGRNTYRFFTPEMQARSARHLELVNALRYALEKEQLSLHYQPQVSLASEDVIGVEALLRWHHPVMGNISPDEFISVAEETGLILSIGEWVIRTAVTQLKSWHQLGYYGLRIAVNLSAVQFRHGDLPNTVTRILQEADLAPEFLELELTESVAMHDPEGAIGIIKQLYERGVRMSIDDFGTGYSSLSYLKKFNVYKLKIDRSFVRDIYTDPEDKAIVSAVIGMANSLGLKTIAEGVETFEQLEFLRQQGCAEVQGYYFSKPLPAPQFEEFMQSRQSARGGVRLVL